MENPPVPDTQQRDTEESDVSLEDENMPGTRPSITHKFSVCGTEGYLTVTVDENGGPRQLFLKVAKEGSTLGGLMDGIGILTSKCFKYGVPLEELVEVMAHTRFEPSGHTGNSELSEASSLLDYIFRWLGNTFESRKEEE